MSVAVGAISGFVTLHYVVADLDLEGNPGGTDPSPQPELSAEYAPLYTAANTSTTDESSNRRTVDDRGASPQIRSRGQLYDSRSAGASHPRNVPLAVKG